MSDRNANKGNHAMPRNVTGTHWTFKTANFLVSLRIERDHGYRYDGGDADGETQAKLDSGEYVAFDSYITVTMLSGNPKLNGKIIGRSALGGSVYARETFADFYTGHRSADPMNRNCTLMRQARSGSSDAKYSICHYFPGMVSEAVAEARAYLQDMPRVRRAV